MLMSIGELHSLPSQAMLPPAVVLATGPVTFGSFLCSPVGKMTLFAYGQAGSGPAPG